MIPALPWLRRRRSALALLAVPALLLRAFLPVGFMPVAATDGWIGFCPGAGGAPDDPTPAHHAPCLFAAGLLPAFSPSVLGFAALRRIGQTQLPAAQVSSAAVAAIERAQSPRAPPV